MQAHPLASSHLRSRSPRDPKPRERTHIRSPPSPLAHLNWHPNPDTVGPNLRSRWNLESAFFRVPVLLKQDKGIVGCARPITRGRFRNADAGRSESRVSRPSAFVGRVWGIGLAGVGRGQSVGLPGGGSAGSDASFRTHSEAVVDETRRTTVASRLRRQRRCAPTCDPRSVSSGRRTSKGGTVRSAPALSASDGTATVASSSGTFVSGRGFGQRMDRKTGGERGGRDGLTPDTRP